MIPVIRTRVAWIHEATVQLGVSAYHFLTLALAVKNGKARWARSWRPIIDEKLQHRIASLLSEPVALEFDPTAAIEFVIGEVEQAMVPLRAEVERKFGEVRPVRRALTRRDEGAVLVWVRAAVVAVIGEVHHEGPNSSGSTTLSDPAA